jgi:GxxExxY protein
MTLEQITYKINGCAMKVHNTLGNGFQEVIYQRCLAIELQKAGLEFGREIEQTIYYDGIKVGTRRADFVVEGQIIVYRYIRKRFSKVHYQLFGNRTVFYRNHTQRI